MTKKEQLEAAKEIIDTLENAELISENNFTFRTKRDKEVSNMSEKFHEKYFK
jgi:hypothetical protein